MGGEADDEQLYRGSSSESDAEDPFEDRDSESDVESLCPPEYALYGSNDTYYGTVGADSASSCGSSDYAMDFGAGSETSSMSDDGVASAFETDAEFLFDAMSVGAPGALAESDSEALIELLRE